MVKKLVGIIVFVLLIIGGISINAVSINIDINNIDSFFEDPPESFDLRDVNGKNYVTGVKDQRPYATCWAHAIMACMEGNLLITDNWKNAGEEGEPDLSESHIDWWNGFNVFNNDDVPGSDGLSVHYGAEIRTASAYFSRGEGAVREIDARYNETIIPPERTNSSYHYYYLNNIEWYDIGENLTNMNLIKNKLMSYGPIDIAFCYDIRFLDRINYTYYQPPNNSLAINHDVAVIGWDNNKETQAPYPGAWLCKNSHGIDWGLDGYFWISYYDKYCCHYDDREWTASFQGVEPMPYNQFFYHDYHGWQDTLDECTEAFNAFHTKSGTTLQAVNFFTASDNVDYIVRIYDVFEENEVKEELSSISGTIQNMGFHTVRLSNPVDIIPEDDFYIYLSLSNGGQPYDRTIEKYEWWGNKKVESISHPGESYYYKDGVWHDFYDFDNTSNFCIKGLAISPRFNITIKHRLGLGVSAEIKNIGLTNATNVPWEITVLGGTFGRINKTVKETIDIPIGESKTVRTRMLFGIGPITIIARIADEEQTAKGKQIIIFTIVN